MKKGVCAVEGCHREAVLVDLCKPCYQSEFKWARRKPADRNYRRQQLDVFQARMARLSLPRKQS